MDIEWFRGKIRREDFPLSSHACEECDNENISLQDIEQAIFNGEILEEYADRKDIRGDSCLILGRGINDDFLHVVTARSSLDEARVVTTYLPKPPKWIDERTRRPTK